MSRADRSSLVSSNVEAKDEGARMLEQLAAVCASFGSVKNLFREPPRHQKDRMQIVTA
jgi:hypothetical protein